MRSEGDVSGNDQRPTSVDRVGPPAADSARLLRPCVHVFFEPLWVEREDGLRVQLEELRAPVLTLSFEYEGFRVRASDPSTRIFCGHGGAMVAALRDREAESRARLLLESFGAIELELLDGYATAPGCEAEYAILPEAGEQAQCAFVSAALPQLRALGWDVRVDEDYPYRVLPAADWYARLDHGEDKPDWFGLELGVEVAGHRIDLLPLLLGMLEDAGKRFALERLGEHAPRFVRVPGQGAYLELPATHFRTLVRVLAELYQGEGADACLPIVRAAALFQLGDALAQTHTTLRFEGTAAGVFGARPRHGVMPQAAGTLETAVPSAELHAELRPYQLEGLAFLQALRGRGGGGVLADDMGLGKTLQLIAHLCAEKDSGRAQQPSLVVAPTSLIGNWRRELARFAPGLRVAVLFGAGREAARATLGRVDVALTSYSLLLRDADKLQEQTYHSVVLDEAQAIKNPRSQAARLVKGLQCEQRIALTGTPIENHLHELWSLFDFALPGLLGSEEQFRAFYRVPIEQERNAERLATLRAQVAPFCLRRMKEQVATELPPKTEVVRPVELRGKQRELYESIRVAAHEKVRSAMRQRGVGGSTVTILAALTKLRQLCCDPRLVHGEQARLVQESAKYELLFELLRQQQTEGRRTLVFSQFTSMLGLISQGLREHGIAHASLTGSTADRERPVRVFQEGEVSVFLVSLKAGGTGLNLTAADTVIHYDPWWNPAAQDQATDRAHRIGQDKPVFVYSLIAAGSVEERMLALQHRKRKLASAVITTAGQGSSPLVEAEVEHLLAPLDE